MMRSFYPLFFIFYFLWVPVTFARDYQVELLVFTQSDDSSNVEEHWFNDSNLALSYQENLSQLSRKSIALPSPSDGVNRLKSIETTLVNSGHQILKSAHWRQQASIYRNAPVYNISDFDSDIQGFLRIYKTSLIFVDIHLVYSEDFISSTPTVENEDINLSSNTINSTHTFSPEKSETLTYFINEKRRLKFKEIHYIDHPKFGAILGVWPTE